MNSIDLDALAALARAANPYTTEDDETPERTAANVAFARAATPAAVLDLIGEVERLRAALDLIFAADTSDQASGGEMWYAEAMSRAVMAARAALEESRYD